MADFRGLRLSEPVPRSVVEMGFQEPTPIQGRAIPCLMEGRDAVAQALTGTGTTAAFGIPLVERTDIERIEPKTVVLGPTRELAAQVEIDEIFYHVPSRPKLEVLCRALDAERPERGSPSPPPGVWWTR